MAGRRPNSGRSGHALSDARTTSTWPRRLGAVPRRALPPAMSLPRQDRTWRFYVLIRRCSQRPFLLRPDPLPTTRSCTASPTPRSASTSSVLHRRRFEPPPHHRLRPPGHRRSDKALATAKATRELLMRVRQLNLAAGDAGINELIDHSLRTRRRRTSRGRVSWACRTSDAVAFGTYWLRRFAAVPLAVAA
jgi:hypothetical protein